MGRRRRRSDEGETQEHRKKPIMKNIMLDLETLGNKPGCVIVAIGAVRFGDGELGEEFYMRVEAQSCVRAGLKLEADTVLWWLRQSDVARNELTKPGARTLAEGLNGFADFSKLKGEPQPLVWGNGSDFDNTILAAAYAAADRSLPWNFWNNRCYRTLKALRPDIKIENEGVKHNALDDAKAQARHLMAMFPQL